MLKNKIIIGTRNYGEWFLNRIKPLIKNALLCNNIEICYENKSVSANLLIVSEFGNWTPNNENIKFVYISGENKFNNFDKHINCLFSINAIQDDINNHNRIYNPFCSASIPKTKFDIDKLNIFRKSIDNFEKYYISMNRHKTEKRETLLNNINNRLNNKIDFLGGKIPDNHCKLHLHIKEMKYLFYFAFENSIGEGYVTEKIMIAFKSGCIPIYWGSNYVKNIFNPKSFIYLDDFKSFNDLADYLNYLSTNFDECKKYLNEPIFTDNIIPECLKIGIIKDVGISSNYKKCIDLLKTYFDTLI